ncbi:MAG: FG-GAP repeat domain-containing protein [Salinibacter sp.]
MDRSRRMDTTVGTQNAHLGLFDRGTLGVLVLAGGLIALLGCQSDTSRPQQETEPQVQPELAEQKSGQALAKQYCSSCHRYPEPNLLDKTAWREHVLPPMGYMLGIYPGGERPDSLFESGRAGELVRQARIYPKTPQLSRSKWKRIVRFYTENAPEDPLPQKSPPNIELGLDQFEVRFPDFRMEPPLTTLVHIDTARSRVLVGDFKQDVSTLNILGRQGTVNNRLAVGSAPSSLHMRQGVPFVANMGEFMPSDRPNGRLIRLLQQEEGSSYDSYYTILDSLQRPAHFAASDLTGNGMTDVVVCEFGYHTGRLAWFENEGGGRFAEHVLMPKPGATRAYIRDLNDDDRPDIIAQMGQGDEGIDIYYNRGDGRFERERVLQFHPAYGSSYFELVDFNRDGHLDILYTNGDNGDYYPTLKRYHGVRIFMNDGSNEFEERYFFPLNGAYRAKAVDFDRDGDLDIAAIGFYPDFRDRPRESFVYLENRGDLSFDARTFEGYDRGRWLVLDTGDLTGDEAPDIVLGSFTGFQAIGDTTGLNKKWWKEGPSIAILENQHSSDHASE